jgi:hypothetical protein
MTHRALISLLNAVLQAISSGRLLSNGIPCQGYREGYGVVSKVFGITISSNENVIGKLRAEPLGPKRVIVTLFPSVLCAVKVFKEHDSLR